MKYTLHNGVPFSRFALGTVQLGLNYGIANSSGKPSTELAFEIMDKAVSLGVNNFDTAAGYGDSEEIIGAWLKTCPPEKKPLITTKIVNFDHSSPAALEESLKSKVDQCRIRLGLDSIPLLMLHHSGDFMKDPAGVMAALKAVKNSGSVERIGISLYQDDDYDLIANSEFDAVQIPQNIFDWRMIDNGKLGRLSAAGNQIFVRSVFLQGLVFKDPETLHPAMASYAPALRKYRALCEKYALTPAALAASFVLALPGVTSLVLGCEKTEQVEANAQLIESCVALSQAQLDEIHEAFLDVEPSMLDPRIWPGHC